MELLLKLILKFQTPNFGAFIGIYKFCNVSQTFSLFNFTMTSLESHIIIQNMTLDWNLDASHRHCFRIMKITYKS